MTDHRHALTIQPQNERTAAIRREWRVRNPRFLPSTGRRSQKRVDRRSIFPVLCAYRPRFRSNWAGSEVVDAVFRINECSCFIHREIEDATRHPFNKRWSIPSAALR